MSGVVMVRDYIKIAIECFSVLYPSAECTIEFVEGLSVNGEGPWGCTTVSEEDGKIYVDVDVDLPFKHVPEILLHEFAHVVTHDKNIDEHGPEWNEAFDKLCDLFYQRTLPEEDKDGGNN